MEQVWRAAPVAALRVWREAGALRTEPNEAARAWGAENGVVDAGWLQLAEQSLREPDESDFEVRLGAPQRTMRCRCVLLPDGAVLWLTPPVTQEQAAGSLAAQLDAVQEFGRMGLYARDLRSDRGYWDRHIFRIVGLQVADDAPDVETFMRDAVHPDDVQRMAGEWERASRQAGRGSMRFRIRRPDGEVRHLHSQFEVRLGADGLPERTVGVLIDDTDSVIRFETQRRASDYLERAIRLAGISVWRLDDATQRIHINAAGFEMVGLQPDPQGVPVERMRASLHPQDVQAVVRAAEEAHLGDRVVDVIARYATPGFNGWRTLLTRRVAERDEQGVVTGLAGISLDLTALMAERARADELAELARLATETLGVAFWSRDLDAGTVHWDEQMYRLYQRAPQDGPPSTEEALDRYVHAADRDWVAEAYARSNAAWDPQSGLTFRITSPAGSERWVQTWTRRVVRGGRRQCFGMHIEVTQRHLAELAMQRERDRFRFAVDAAGIGVWERDFDSGQSYWNESMYRLRGFDPADPRPPAELGRLAMDPDDRRRLEAMALRHVDAGEPFNAEVRVRWPDGTQRWLATHGRLLVDPARARRAMAGINVDITERKRADALRQEILRAEQASRDSATFIARVSHELRTPMNAIVGFTDLLINEVDKPAGATTLQRLGYIRSSARHLRALVDDVLELSRLDAAQAVLAHEPVDLAATVAQALQWVAESAQQAEVTVEAVELGAAAVLADPRRLGQVLANLLTNAIKYNRRGGWVRVSLRRSEGDRSGMLGLVVADGGHGIDPSDLAQVFEPFERAGAERGAIEGTGIGLTIARHLVQLMGGAIEARSTLGEGSEFIVWLSDGGPERCGAAAAPELGSTAGPPAQGRAMVVLCVEDNPVNLQLVRELFALRPQAILHTAETGLDAVARAPSIAPDVVLLDMQLPDIDGAEVMRRLQGRSEFARTRFIALSANAMPDHVSQALAAGFDDYWTKPIDFAQFLGGLDRLAQALDRV